MKHNVVDQLYFNKMKMKKEKLGSLVMKLLELFRVGEIMVT